jgi:AcrR family transcriptional regulator
MIWLNSLAINKNVGRPRLQWVDDAILDAAKSLFYREAYAQISMEAIAQKAGVSKATLYRRWPNKSALAVEVLVHTALAERRKYGKTSYRQHLVSNLCALRDMLASPYAAVMISLIAEAQKDNQLHQLLYQKFLRPIQAVGDADLEIAIERGEIKADVDKDLLFDQLFGFFYYRMLVVRREITDAEIEQVADNFLTSLSAK